MHGSVQVVSRASDDAQYAARLHPSPRAGMKPPALAASAGETPPRAFPHAHRRALQLCRHIRVAKAVQRLLNDAQVLNAVDQAARTNLPLLLHQPPVLSWSRRVLHLCCNLAARSDVDKGFELATLFTRSIDYK